MILNAPDSWQAPDRSEALERACDVTLLEYHAHVTGPPVLLRTFESLLPKPPSWTVASLPQREEFHLKADAPIAGWHQVRRNGQTLTATDEPDEALSYMLWSIYSSAVAQLGDRYLLFHAGAVAHDGRGILFPASSGSGKSTLVAGLVAAGFQYVSDDVVPVDRASLRMSPFPKSVGVKQGSLRPLATLYPALARESPRLRAFGETVWHLHPPASAWPARPVTIDYVILPGYVRGARTALTPITRSQALLSLLDQSFNVHGSGAAGVERSVALVQRAACFALTVGRLPEAITLVERLLSR